MHTLKPKDVFLFIVKMIRPFWGGIAVMFVVGIYWAIDISLSPYIMKVLLDRLATSTPATAMESLIWPAIAYIALSFGMSTAWRSRDYFVSVKMIPKLRARIGRTNFATLLKKSHSYYQNHLAGSLANKTNDLAVSVPEILESIFDHFIPQFLALSFAIYTLWQVNFKFALCLLIWILVFLGSALLASRRLIHLSDKWSEEVSTIIGRLVDVISGILSVRLFSRKSYERDAFRQITDKATKAEKKVKKIYFLIWCCYGYSFVINLGFNLYFLIQGRVNDTISVGDFALVLTINLAIVEFLWRLAEEFSKFSDHLGKAVQSLRTLMIPDEIKDRPNAQPLIITKGEIVFDQVQFHYKGTAPLFENKAVTIPGGQKVGLVGYSGSGKTTFVNLILRLFEINSGRILIDSQDIRQVTQDSLWEHIGMIPQDPVLFHRSLMENIRYGKADATDEEVIEAAKKAHAHDFIIGLSQGYNSLVGERGIKVSGGQRQRIAIARAILKNAPILILDEATSQLDSVTEQYIQESLGQLMEEKTTIVVAHRLSTLLSMDRILVFDQGKIVEDGTHQELLKKKGLYKTLWDTQVGGFVPEERKD